VVEIGCQKSETETIKERRSDCVSAGRCKCGASTAQAVAWGPFVGPGKYPYLLIKYAMVKVYIKSLLVGLFCPDNVK
jgi:hypothetical protein